MCIYKTLLRGLIFVILIQYKAELKHKIILFSLLFLSITSGVINNSRSYYTGFLLTILFFLIYKIIKKTLQKKYKYLLTTSLIIILFSF